MWRTRPLLLLAMAAIIAAVGFSYLNQVRTRSRTAPKTPAILPDNTASTAQDWSWRQTANGKTTVEIRAHDFRQVRQPNEFELQGVELHLFNRDATSYDLVKCAKASFDIGTGVLFSDGEVEITMNVPADEPPSGKLMVIRSSGVHFETKTGRATTDRAASFEFDRGSGDAVGADYDPQTHELHLLSQVHLLWRGNNPKAPPMHIDTGDLIYKESEAKVYLSPWSKLERDTLTMNGGATVVTLDGGAISLVEADNAHGVDAQAARSLDFSAAHLIMNFDGNGQIDHIAGEPDAQLVSASKSGKTSIHTDHIDLRFAVVRQGTVSESQLTEAVAQGHGVVISQPAPDTKAANPETRILKSDAITMKMRPGGHELDSVATGAPGTLEFLPTQPNRPHRFMTGERIQIAYAAANQIQSVRASNVTTRTENPRLPGAKNAPPPAITSSKDLNAIFDPKTNQLARLEQWGDFKYESGDRRATAESAVLEQQQNLMTLNRQARVWDSTGSTSADKIVLNEKDSDFTADGSVNSVRLPDSNGSSSGMLSANEPMHARADHMQSRDRNREITYRGHAVAWQAANRLQAPVIQIDRVHASLEAHDGVLSELIDKKDNSGKDSAKSPVFTVVRAEDLSYNDRDKLAHYTGGVTLDRPGLTVTGREVFAYLRASDNKGAKPAAQNKPPADNGSSLDHALAKGAVEIVSTTTARKRVGTSEVAEYYVDDGKVVLEQGKPKLVDSLKGTTSGERLTWFANNDRLLVSGTASQPASSLLRRK